MSCVGATVKRRVERLLSFSSSGMAVCVEVLCIGEPPYCSRVLFGALNFAPKVLENGTLCERARLVMCPLLSLACHLCLHILALGYYC